MWGWEDICVLYLFIEYRGGDVNLELFVIGNIIYDEYCCDMCVCIVVLIFWFVF